MNSKKEINGKLYNDSAIDLGHSVIFMGEDGIIEIDCSDNKEYEVDEIKQNLECIKKLAQGKKVLVVSNSKQYSTVTKEARHYIAAGPHKDFILAEAFVIHTLGQVILGNLYLSVNNPVVPAKMFKTKEAAKIWLKSFL